MTSGTSSTPAPAPESAPEPAQTPTPAKPTPPGKPAKLKALTADPPVTEPGGTSRITAEVVNPDSVPLTFSWAASGGSISGADAQALWVAPQTTGEFTISVVVKDSKGRTTSGSIGVYVQGGSSKPAPTPTPTAPTITALTADPTVTPPGGSSSITAEVINPDSVPLTFSWAASGGTITGAQAQALWIAPQSTGEFTISVAAKDSYGRTASGSIAVSVQTSSSPVPLPSPLPPPPPSGTRDPFLWPLASESPWNMPIGTGAVYADITGSAWNLNTIGIYFNGPNGHTKAIYKASASDPIRSVRVTQYSMVNTDPDARNYFSTTPGPVTYQFRIPNNAEPSGPPYPQTGDQYMLILDADGETVHEFYHARKDTDGVNWIVQNLLRYKVTLDGYGKSPYGSVTTSGDPRGKHTGRAGGQWAVGGDMRSGELVNGIKHALTAAVGGPQMNKNGPGGKSFVWPASASDDPSSYTSTGNTYMGSLLAIPASVNLDALGFQTRQGLEVARAMQRYGIYITDQASTTLKNALIMEIEWTARGELPEQYNSSSPFYQDLRLAARHLKVITNNGPNSIGGGGTPLAPLAPPFGTPKAMVPGGRQPVAADARRLISTTSQPTTVFDPSAQLLSFMASIWVLRFSRRSRLRKTKIATAQDSRWVPPLLTSFVNNRKDG